MHYGSQLLFSDVNLTLTKGKRYGIVGANGTGKSTLLKILCKEEEQTNGTIGIPKNATVGWLKQDQYLHEEKRLIDIVIQGRPELWRSFQEKNTLLEEENWTDEMVEKLSQCEENIERLEGYSAESLAEKLLIGLGIPHDRHESPLKELSGGFKIRVLLARTLFNVPDILLLDEPTNNLDIQAIRWLERYLQQDFQGLLIFVSHDRKLLNTLTTHILDVDYGSIQVYTGNFETFLKLKEKQFEQKETEKKHVERKVKELERFVEKFKSKASKARQAMSREKMIDRIDIPELEKSSRAAPKFNFKQKRPSGKIVLKCKEIYKSYDNNPVLLGVSTQIERGEKIAVLGANGMGKSTLLKIILSLINADEGEFSWGHETHVSYFSQNHHELLNSSISAYHWLSNQLGHENIAILRSLLAMALFTQDDAHKNVLNLSGGKSARLVLASMIGQHDNVLILDEPTNHMDLESIDSLSSALKNFEGTVICVSHDRHFVSDIADRILILNEEGLHSFNGSYQEFVSSHNDDTYFS